MKRGSALLIVLGLISFLVVSAVAFSAYMRLSRLPSSYLLRTSSSRYLVKAALAEAMNSIDAAVANNPHPGVGTRARTESGRTSFNHNQWRDRVFFGTNLPISVESTVSTLTLEGLAYVPAPIINDVRYWSRRSPAAVWHELDFDAGRYAFTAIDVSDYFDVNRTMAAPGGGGRTSAADARVSLAYLFEDEQHTGWRVNPSVWDAFMDNFLDEDPTAGSKVPLISWADLNLALWDKKPGDIISPWCRFIENGTSFVQDNPAERFALSNMVFATDSFYPREKADANLLDIDSGANQPFAGLRIQDKTGYRNRGVDALLQNNNAFMTKFANNISPPELVQLCDYLDADSVPTSLALPTTERVPMLTGVSLSGSSLQYDLANRTETLEKTNPSGAVVVRFTIDYYTLKLNGELKPMVSAVYPFKYARGGDETDSFKAQVAATVTLVPQGSETALRRRNAASPATLSWDNGSRSEQSAFGSAAASDCNSVWVLRSGMQQLSVKRSPTSDDDCLIGPVDPSLRNFTFSLSSQVAPSALVAAQQLAEPEDARTCTLRVVKQQNYDPLTQQPVGQPQTEVTKGFLPSNAELSGPFANTPANVPDGAVFVPAIQLGVRIVNSAGDTVDMMPACADDDARPSELLRGENLRSAFERPFLRFYDKNQTMAVSFTEQWFAAYTPQQPTLYPEAYVADDPRFNHAPEDLVAVQTLGGEIQRYWLDNNTSEEDGKDGDIYMAASDAGYLQDKFELGFLLNITGLFGNDMWGALNSGGYNGVARTEFGGAPSQNAMWRTYSPYRVNGRTGIDDIDKLEMTSSSDGSRVCPYTPDTAVMMGALANTPRDWWTAATNDVGIGAVKQQILSSIDEAVRYTFSERSTEQATRVKYASLERLAGRLISEFRDSPTVDGWRDIYDGLDWDGIDEQKYLFKSVEDDNASVTFHSVDRKYLFGFWRGCFAARQQLFLVFVRAEPMMMGGGLNGQMPPMLGARAVALVWRDPAATREDLTPHRMRVLFYRQLD